MYLSRLDIDRHHDALIPIKKSPSGIATDCLALGWRGRGQGSTQWIVAAYCGRIREGARVETAPESLTTGGAFA